MVYDGNARVATLEEGYNEDAFLTPVIKYYKGSQEVEACTDAGTYTAKVTFGSATATVTFTIENWVIPVLDKGVTLEIEGAPEDDTIEVEVEVKTDISTDEATSSYNEAVSKMLEKDQKVALVYGVKLIQKTIVGGVETRKEIQPSDIKPGITIVIKMDIPEQLQGKAFKLLHIHSAEDIEYVNDFKVSDDGTYLTVKVTKLSEFAFVETVALPAHGFCIGYIVLILAILLLIYTVFYVFLYFNLFTFLSSLRKSLSLINLISLICAAVIFIFGLVVLIIHACPASIISFIIIALEFILILILFILYMLNKNKDNKEEKAEPEEEKQTEANNEVEDIKEEAKEEEKPLENQAEEVISDEESEEYDEEEDEEEIVTDEEGHFFKLMYNKSFTAKLIQASDETKNYYQELKNYVLSYKGTTSRISWNYDSINRGRANLLKFNFKRKHLYVYFALNADEYAESKYNLTKVESKKYQSTPAMFAVRNDRNLKYAKELIDIVCANLEKGEDKNENYYLPYEETKPLIEKGLIKEVRSPLQEKPKPKVKVRKAVSVQEVNELMSNEDTKELIIDEREVGCTGKKDIINIIDLVTNFNEGDTVTIDILKEKNLVPKNSKQVKLLASGKIDKKLNIELQDFSIEAAKMIILAGGTVKRVK